jgi:hypothetical protein
VHRAGFGVLTLAGIIAAASPVLAQLGGTCVVASLFGHLYFSGVEVTPFRLVDAEGLQNATNFVLDVYVELSYGLWYIPVAASAGALVGGLLLCLGAFLPACWCRSCWWLSPRGGAPLTLAITPATKIFPAGHED